MVDFNKKLKEYKAIKEQEKEQKERTMGYTPTRRAGPAGAAAFKRQAAGTTSRQRFGSASAASRESVPQDGHHRTPEGREVAAKVKAEQKRVLDPTLSFPAMEEDGIACDGPSFLPGAGPVLAPPVRPADAFPAPLTIAGVLGLPEEKPAARKPTKSDSFPLVSAFSRADMDESIRLMEDDINYQEQEEAIKEARKRIKLGLADIAKRNHTPGMRWGQLAVYYYGAKTKKTLNKLRLVEEGVPVDTIMACYVESEPWMDVRVKDLSKPPKPKRGKYDESLEEED